MVEEFK